MAKTRSKRKVIVRDICLIVAVALVGVILLLVIHGREKVGTNVVVMFQNEVKATYSLTSDGIYDINDGKNIIEILDGKVRMLDADCHDRLCVRQLWIEYDGQSIICLPNRITVTVTGGDKAFDFVL